MNTKIDLLAIVAHPDDAELAFGGTLAAYASKGKKTAIIDLTQGEMGTRGNAATRSNESAKAAEILSLTVRENLSLPDCNFENNQTNRYLIIDVLRRYRPRIVITNAPSDRHPDHAKAAQLVRDSCFYSGLKKIETDFESFRPKQVFFSIQSNYLRPDFLFDVSGFWEKKMEAIRAYKSQFFNPESTDEQTFISTPEFLEFIEARARDWGQSIGVKYAEGFIAPQPFGIKDFDELI